MSVDKKSIANKSYQSLRELMQTKCATNPILKCMFNRLTLLLMIAPIACTSPMTEQEKLLVGSWRHKVNASQDSIYTYLELDPERIGKYGVVAIIKGQITRIPGATFTVTNWKISNDTLVMDQTLKDAIVSVPNKNDTIVNGPGITSYLILKKINEFEFLAEEYHPNIPYNSHLKFKRIKRLD